MSARRPLLLPLVPLYRAGLHWKNRRYDRDPRLARALRDPVLSVGGLSAGGSGKTPFLIALAGLVRELGFAPDVLSRGYRRSSKGVLRVDPRGRASDFGDEPLLLARTLGCPVYVGSERYDAGLRAETELPDAHRGVHLLDDGFAHRRLARAVEIVLLTADDVGDVLLPAGNLREPLSSLQRADIVVLRASEAESLRPVVARAVAGARQPVRTWVVQREMTLPVSMPSRAVTFSAIARPADFERMLAARGVSIVAKRRFRDHHRYAEADVRALVALAREHQANGFVTTAKDAVKLDDALLQALRGVGPVAVADAVVTLQDRARCAEDLRMLLRERVPHARHIVGAAAPVSPAMRSTLGTNLGTDSGTGFGTGLDGDVP